MIVKRLAKSGKCSVLVEAIIIADICRACIVVSPRLLQLDVEGTVLSVNLRAVESGGVVTEAPSVGLHPAAAVEAVKVVLPVEVEATGRRVPLLNFDVVVAGVPGHVVVVEVVTPAWEGRRPEVHHEVLRLVQEVHTIGAFGLAAHVSIDSPRDIVRGPLDHVLVPVLTWPEVLAVELIILLPLPDDVSAEWSTANRGHHLHIDLVPALLSPVRPSPVREEGGDGAILIGTLHAHSESTVGEGLVGLDLTTAVVGDCNASECHATAQSLQHLLYLKV